jgi:hypothetical protein
MLWFRRKGRLYDENGKESLPSRQSHHFLALSRKHGISSDGGSVASKKMARLLKDSFLITLTENSNFIAMRLI